MLEAMDHDLHRMRRNSVAHFFSKRSVHALEPLVVQCVQGLMDRFRGELKNSGIVNLNYAYAAMTMDIISEYCFGESMKSLEREAYGKEWLDILHDAVQMRPLGRQFPTLVNLLFDLPPDIVAKVSPAVEKMNAWNASLFERIERIMRYEDGGDEKKLQQRTIFHEIRDDVGGKLPEEEKATLRLAAEGSTFLGAGTETTSRTLAVATYYLVKEREVGERLREELRGVLKSKDDRVSLPQLEALPYLVSPFAKSTMEEEQRLTEPPDCRRQ